MATTAEQINLWRQAPSERQRLEFKEAKQQFDTRKLNEYCVGLANEGGEFLLLGIADKIPRPVVGTQSFQNIVLSLLLKTCLKPSVSAWISRKSTILMGGCSSSTSNRDRAVRPVIWTAST